jgi:hypothetical protein
MGLVDMVAYHLVSFLFRRTINTLRGDNMEFISSIGKIFLIVVACVVVSGLLASVVCKLLLKGEGEFCPECSSVIVNGKCSSNCNVIE